MYQIWRLVMKKLLVLLFPLVALLVMSVVTGCGASKTYVDQAVSDERARAQADVDAVEKDVAANKAEMDKLAALTKQLETKTNMAINEAKGFENYIVIWEATINFPFDSYELTVEAKDFLDQGGDMMVANPKAIMELAGYTDPTGDAAYNMMLGDKRAAAAKYYLVDSYGVSLFRIFNMSYGETKAQSGDTGGVKYSQQRKVTLKLWGPQK